MNDREGIVVALVQLADRVYLAPGGVNVGVVAIDDDKCLLIDTGLNDTSAKKALKVVHEELSGNVVAILTTHAHADHFGGNATVVKRTGARVFAPEIDEAILRYPILQPASLVAGADPLDSLRTSFLLADSSSVDEVIKPGPREVEGVQIEVMSLAGHSPNQVGYLVDGVFFCADVVLPETVLAKYRIPYLYSVTAHLAALETAAGVTCNAAVPGHGAVLDDLKLLIELNQRLVNEVTEFILESAKEPKEASAILTAVLRRFEAPVNDASSYYLLHPTIFAFLSHLARNGLIAHEVRDGQSLFARL
jgi:glyoxylase-like metal-dependent hydrolase (beta-lactamase superfamily II)